MCIYLLFIKIDDDDEIYAEFRNGDIPSRFVSIRFGSVFRMGIRSPFEVFMRYLAEASIERAGYITERGVLSLYLHHSYGYEVGPVRSRHNHGEAFMGGSLPTYLPIKVRT